MLFTGYNLALKWATPVSPYFQNQWEKNISLAESYALDNSVESAVIVGSSLAARLESQDLGSGIRNLSFAGGASVTGLELLNRRKNPPRVVLVETNVLRDLDSVFMRDTFNPLSLGLKRIFPSAQVRYRPINLLLGKLKGGSAQESIIPDSSVFMNLLQGQQRAHERAPDSIWLAGQLASLKDRVDSLSAKGTRVVFFTLPVHPEIAGSARATGILKAYRETFPLTQYDWIETFGGEYLTTDGVHLVPQSAQAYAVEIREKIRSVRR